MPHVDGEKLLAYYWTGGSSRDMDNERLCWDDKGVSSMPV